MPAMTISKINGATSNGEAENDSASEKMVLANNNQNTAKSNTDTLLDLLVGDDIIMSTPTATIPSTNSAPAASNDLLDLLGGIDMDTTSIPVVSMNNNNNLSSPVTMSIFDDNENTKIPNDGSIFALNGGNGAQVPGGNYDLGLDFLTSSTSATTTNVKIITVFDKNDLLITFANSKQGDSIQVMMTTTNNSMDTLEQYLFQVRGENVFTHCINFFRNTSGCSSQELSTSNVATFGISSHARWNYHTRNAREKQFAKCK